jgi:hypothetical protein
VGGGEAAAVESMTESTFAFCLLALSFLRRDELQVIDSMKVKLVDQLDNI